MSDHPHPEVDYHERYSDDEDDAARPSDKINEPEFKKDILINPSSPGIGGPSATLSRYSLEASWINAEPFDEFVREIGDFISEVSRGRSNIEIEGRIGLLIDKNTNQRVNFPVMSEIILSPQYNNVRFESNMTLDQHAHYNRILNQRVATTATPSYPYSKLQYSHTKVTDSFHTVQGQRVRVTTDEKGKKESVTKVRIADLNVYSPKRKVDWRVSVSIETPVPLPTSIPETTRRKDRMTYTHQGFQIDLTQVESSHGSSQLQHELEVEFRDPDELMRLASLREQHHEGGWAFDELIRVFVNNLRVLARNAM